MDAGSVLSGKYRLVSLIGRGGMGSVWKAEHLGLRAPVAVKLIDQSIAMLPEALSRFHREAQAAASLRSPHVVQILDHGVDEASQVPFIVMELMEGESLASRLHRVERLTAPQTAGIVSQVARALVRAHEAGIVHRDLKPDNIFLIRNEDEEIAKVLDFGIAKSKAHAIGADTATRTGSVLGTPYYMSPEQISGSKEIDFRTDLWALAVIAYEMLTGKRPYTADTVGGLAIEICTRRPLPPSSHAPVPIGFDAWFDRATSVDPAQRYGSARELAEDLRRICGTSSNRSMSGSGDHGVRTISSTSARSLDALSNTNRAQHAAQSAKNTWKWAAVAGAIIVSGLGVASWLTSSSSEMPAPAVLSSPALEPKTADPKATAAPAPAPLPAATHVDLPPPAPAAEVPLVEPPTKIDVTKNAPRARDESPRKAKTKVAGASTATRGAAPPPAATPSNSDSLPENGSLLDDRK